MWKTALLLLTLLVSGCGTNVRFADRPPHDAGASFRWERPARIVVRSISGPEPLAYAMMENSGGMEGSPSVHEEAEQFLPAEKSG
jgi:hypothetical protein